MDARNQTSKDSIDRQSQRGVGQPTRNKLAKELCLAVLSETLLSSVYHHPLLSCCCASSFTTLHRTTSSILSKIAHHYYLHIFSWTSHLVSSSAFQTKSSPKTISSISKAFITTELSLLCIFTLSPDVATTLKAADQASRAELWAMFVHGSTLFP